MRRLRYTLAHPRYIPCDRCGGTGGWNRRPRSGGDPFEPDAFYWWDCDDCDGTGAQPARFQARARGRRRVAL